MWVPCAYRWICFYFPKKAIAIYKTEEGQQSIIFVDQWSFYNKRILKIFRRICYHLPGHYNLTSLRSRLLQQCSAPNTRIVPDPRVSDRWYSTSPPCWWYDVDPLVEVRRLSAKLWLGLVSLWLSIWTPLRDPWQKPLCWLVVSQTLVVLWVSELNISYLSTFSLIEWLILCNRIVSLTELTTWEFRSRSQRFNPYIGKFNRLWQEICQLPFS